MTWLFLFISLTASTFAGDSSLEADVERYLAETDPLRAMRHVESGLTRFESPSSRSAMHVRGRMLMDWSFQRSEQFVDVGTVFFRQLRLGIDGHIFERTIYSLEISFTKGGDVGLQDVFVGLRDLGVFGTFQVGHQRRPFSLDGMTSIVQHMFMERAASTRAFQLGRDTGLRFHNSSRDRRLAWTVGVFKSADSSGDASQSDGESVAVRVSGLPWRDLARDLRLHVGASVSFARPTGSMAQFRTRPGPNDGPRYLDTGSFPADSVFQASIASALLLGSIGMQLEGFVARAEGDSTSATFWGAYVQFGWWVTGEAHAFNDLAQVPGRVRPLHDFHAGDLGGGALLLALRADFIDLTDGVIVGGEMFSLTVGLTWKVNPFVLAKLNLVYADIENGAEGSGELYYLMVRFQYDF